MCEIIWRKMDEHQRQELVALYGDKNDAARRGMWRECRTSGHQAAFFDGATLVSVMWSEWTNVRGIGSLRVFGCFCNSEYAREHTLKFVKNTPVCIDSFMLDEPPDVSELYVFIAKDYRQSRKWAVMFGGLEKAFDAHSREHKFVCYKIQMGGM